MTFHSPNLVALYAETTQKLRPFNDARRRCAGCATMRSIGQFQPSESTYCLLCTRRNVCTPKASKRRPAAVSRDPARAPLLED